MLNRKETHVMSYLYERLIGKQSLLIAPQEILEILPETDAMEEEELSEVLKGLALDGYIDVVNSDKKGQTIYCLSLRSRGQAFEREKERKKKQLMMRVGLTIGLAFLSFLITMILRSIF